METVCHVITKLELGGAQEVALYAVSHLDRKKFRPVLIAGPGGFLTEEARRLPGVQTIIVPSLGRQIHAISDLFALFHLIILFRRLCPAIVHTHSSKAGILGRWAAWLARVPVIIHTVHGFGITPAQPVWLRRILIMLERMTGWITTHWITVAQIDAQTGRQWQLFDSNVSVIRPGIDPRPFQQPLEPSVRNNLREEFGAGSDEYLIGTVACLKPQKAPEDVVAVAKLVCAAHTSSPICRDRRRGEAFEHRGAHPTIRVTRSSAVGRMAARCRQSHEQLRCPIAHVALGRISESRP